MKIYAVSQQNSAITKNYAPNFGKVFIKESFWETGLLLRGRHPEKDEFLKQMQEVEEQNPDIDYILDAHKVRLSSRENKTFVDISMRYTQDKVKDILASIDESSKYVIQGKERQRLYELISSSTNVSIPTVMESFHLHPELLTEGLASGIGNLFSIHRQRYPKKAFEIAPNCDKLETIRSAVNISKRKASKAESKLSLDIQRRLFDAINIDLAFVPDDDKSDFFSEKYFFEAQVIYANMLKPEEMPYFLEWIDKSMGAELILNIPNGEEKFKRAIRQTSIEDQQQWEDAFELVKKDREKY